MRKKLELDLKGYIYLLLELFRLSQILWNSFFHGLVNINLLIGTFSYLMKSFND